MATLPSIFQTREVFSRMRLAELRRTLASHRELTEFPGLTVFGAGSYARLEASAYSDLDVFFLCSGCRKELPHPRTAELRLFGKVIEAADRMEFPEFSNDCQYLVVQHTGEMIDAIGSPKDDHDNYFTARMLLLLESQCLFGDDTYRNIIARIVGAYFKDYADHQSTFKATFLINDICRFWKTLLLNYEHKRGLELVPEEVKVKQKVKNFKLKYSRMTTCFASLASLGSHQVPVTEQQVIQLTSLTPRQRLESVALLIPEADNAVQSVLDSYAWFLEMTGLPTNELEQHFSDKEKRTEMFKLANAYGDTMFDLLRVVSERTGILRYLVI